MCPDCEKLQAEHDQAIAELKKHLKMCPGETLIGGIRNLAQVCVGYRDRELERKQSEKTSGTWLRSLFHLTR
jgi:hypothetical protein